VIGTLTIEFMAERTFQLYDSMSKQVKALEPIESGHLRFYTCGPTVYSYAHIGNFRSFLTADLIVRTARAIGWTVTWVCNVTDVGHLTQDDVADATGEDKMERALRSKEGERFNNVWELAEYYTKTFLEDWSQLNLVEPTVRPKATQHVREQILATEALIKSGHAYETPDAVYFRISSFTEYGKLSGNTQENLRAAVREVVLDSNKEEQADFALWKKDEKHLMQWYSPFGWGFPGWHIECTVMSRAYLGDTIDLHSGGEDNMFPHHECEIAQSESLTGKPFCNHWIHTRWLQVNGAKMSKSSGSFYTVRGLVEQGIDPVAVRYALMSGVYRKPYNFTDQGLLDAVSNVERLRRAKTTADDAVASGTAGEDALGHQLEEIYEAALEAMCDDLNTSIALAKALEGAKLINRESESMSAATGLSAQRFIQRIEELLGLPGNDPNLKPEPSVDGLDEQRIENLIADRAAAKKSKDFARADSIRIQLADLGIELRDSPEGTTWSRRTTL
jgi:cysteinyl-tRNA synthetase